MYSLQKLHLIQFSSSLFTADPAARKPVKDDDDDDDDNDDALNDFCFSPNVTRVINQGG